MESLVAVKAKKRTAPGLNCFPKAGRTSKGFMTKYKKEFKLEVVKSFLTGDGGTKLLARC